MLSKLQHTSDTYLKDVNTCLSCGTVLKDHQKHYCSVQCPQKLKLKLTHRIGLLNVLNTKFAAFSFSSETVNLDILPHGSDEILSFIYPRSRLNIPADDFSKMANLLGSAWWAEKKRTNRKHDAFQHMFHLATSQKDTSGGLCPIKISIPAVKGKYLACLRIDQKSLTSAAARDIIKKAYRMQAKKHHPDLGGCSKRFQRIHDAYEKLLRWAGNPSYLYHQGFADKWFYNGIKRRWIQPNPDLIRQFQ